MNKETRPVEIIGPDQSYSNQFGKFHCWGNQEAFMNNDEPYTKRIAIVELDDGSVVHCEPQRLKFLDI